MTAQARASLQQPSAFPALQSSCVTYVASTAPPPDWQHYKPTCIPESSCSGDTGKPPPPPSPCTSFCLPRWPPAQETVRCSEFQITVTSQKPSAAHQAMTPAPVLLSLTPGTLWSLPGELSRREVALGHTHSDELGAPRRPSKESRAASHAGMSATTLRGGAENCLLNQAHPDHLASSAHLPLPLTQPTLASPSPIQPPSRGTGASSRCPPHSRP